MYIMNVQIILNFESMEHMADWFDEQKQFDKYKLKKSLVKENENRGSKTKEYHLLAKEYHKQHPELSYRECIKITSKKDL